MARVTGWFSPDVAPVRDGVYEIRVIEGWFRYWDGSWHVGARTIEEAYALRGNLAAALFQWRGLTKPARGKRG